MRINKIYKFESENETEYVFILKDGRKIIKRSDQKIEKLNLTKWEEISFIPEGFQKIERKATDKEIKEIEKFINKSQESKSFWGKLKNIFK